MHQAMPSPKLISKSAWAWDAESLTSFKHSLLIVSIAWTVCLRSVVLVQAQATLRELIPLKSQFLLRLRISKGWLGTVPGSSHRGAPASSTHALIQECHPMMWHICMSQWFGPALSYISSSACPAPLSLVGAPLSPPCPLLHLLPSHLYFGSCSRVVPFPHLSLMMTAGNGSHFQPGIALPSPSLDNPLSRFMFVSKPTSAGRDKHWPGSDRTPSSASPLLRLPQNTAMPKV